MNDHSGARGLRAADPHPKLRLTALVAVSVGVVLLAAAAFVLSYAGIHEIALAAGVTPRLARFYPLIFDAMLVVAFAAALALRGAGWLTRAYVWLCTLVLLAAVAAGDAVHAMGLALPRKPSAGAVAVIPWILLLLAFGFLLAMLRQLRRARAAAAGGQGAGQPAPGRPAGSNGRQGIDALLDPRPAGAAPALPGRAAPLPAVQPLAIQPVPAQPAITGDGDTHEAGEIGPAEGAAPAGTQVAADTHPAGDAGGAGDIHPAGETDTGQVTHEFADTLAGEDAHAAEDRDVAGDASAAEDGEADEDTYAAGDADAAEDREAAGDRDVAGDAVAGSGRAAEAGATADAGAPADSGDLAGVAEAGPASHAAAAAGGPAVPPPFDRLHSSPIQPED